MVMAVFQTVSGKNTSGYGVRTVGDNCITADGSDLQEIIDHATFGNAFVRLMVVYVLLMLGMQAVTVISSLVSTMLTERFSFGIRKQIYEKIIHSHWMDVKNITPGI